MTQFISFRTINVNAFQENAGVFIGDVCISGWDAHIKANSAHSPISGAHNVEVSTLNVTCDHGELMDGVINDQDFKPVWGRNL